MIMNSQLLTAFPGKARIVWKIVAALSIAALIFRLWLWVEKDTFVWSGFLMLIGFLTISLVKIKATNRSRLYKVGSWIGILLIYVDLLIIVIRAVR